MSAGLQWCHPGRLATHLQQWGCHSRHQDWNFSMESDCRNNYPITEENRKSVPPLGGTNGSQVWFVVCVSASPGSPRPLQGHVSHPSLHRPGSVQNPVQRRYFINAWWINNGLLIDPVIFFLPLFSIFSIRCLFFLSISSFSCCISHNKKYLGRELELTTEHRGTEASASIRIG